mmetsp:Transcript_25237/g.80225  ORF Transcript_25237/g.80225 Transcript_25237/m.80225 type:complete len:325 (-) Transcript_25237:422-1396(-)
MCIAFLLVGGEDDPFRFVVAANRDEFLARPATHAAPWADKADPLVFAGRDQTAGGTWLGVRASQTPTEQAGQASAIPGPEAHEQQLTKQGPADFRFGVITNHREKLSPLPGGRKRPSRGKFISSYLAKGNHLGPRAFCERLVQNEDAGDYSGYNLVLGDHEAFYYFSNRSSSKEPERLSPGVHGVSNGLMDDDWPKVENGKRRFQLILSDFAEQDHTNDAEDDLVQTLFELMRDPTPCGGDCTLPGVFDSEVERALSSIRVAPFSLGPGPDRTYSTRSTAIILVRHDGSLRFVEDEMRTGEPTAAIRRDHTLFFDSDVPRPMSK